MSNKEELFKYLTAYSLEAPHTLLEQANKSGSLPVCMHGNLKIDWQGRPLQCNQCEEARKVRDMTAKYLEARYCLAELKEAVKTAFITGGDGFRELYDEALLNTLEIKSFQNLLPANEDPIGKARDNLFWAIKEKMLGSCTCLTKSHEVQWHRADCTYRLSVELLEKLK